MFTELQNRFGEQFQLNDSLARYTVARLGGTASGILRVKTRDDFIWAIRWAYAQNINWWILGGGANVLAHDHGFDGLVIVNQVRGSDIDTQTGTVTAQAGASLSTLTRHCVQQGLKGLEWGASVPGTVGGAVVNNAGAHSGDMAGNLTTATVYDLQNDEQQQWALANFAYDYRYSVLKGQHGRYVVLDGTLQLEPNHDPDTLKAQVNQFIEHRKRTQPPGASLGSMFKNPPDDYAGRLIEAAGLKGHQIGGVQISPRHANFFVNVGNGTASDYMALIALAQQTVYDQFGVALELEIERLA